LGYTGAEFCPNSAFVSVIDVCCDARFTDRWRDHATSARQRRTLIAKKPKIAPTAIKTVPSGSELVCMYGAPALGGTEAGMILNAPLNVGRPDGSPASSSSPSFAPVIVGTAADLVSATPPVITVVADAVLDGPFVIEPVVRTLPVAAASDLDSLAADSDAIALERFGRPVS